MTQKRRSCRVLILDVPAAFDRAGIGKLFSEEEGYLHGGIPMPWPGMTEGEAEELLFDLYVARRTKMQ